MLELYPNEPQKIKIGESTRMSCRTTAGTPYPTISWSRRDGRPMSSRISEDYPGVITIREATIEDGGIYECHAKNIVGSISVSTSLEILQSPIISLVPNKDSFDITEGDELRISCTAVGIPEPSVQIKKQGDQSMQESFSRDGARSEATLRTKTAMLDHSGLYECTAINEAGQDLRYIQINVAEKRGDVGISDRDDDDEENEVYQPQPTRSPYRPEQNKPQRPERPEQNQPQRPERPDQNQPQRPQRPDQYQPQRPERPEQNQPQRPSYRPQFPVETNTNYNKSISPPFQQPPFYVHLSERAELKCQAEDNSMRTEWRRADGRSLPSGSQLYGGSLIIEVVRQDAAGAYECIAYDQSRRPITLVIASIIVQASPPRISFSPPMPIVVKSGEDVIIHCNVSGEEPLRVHWHGENGYDLPK